MKSGYDLKGNVILERNTGEKLKLNYFECLEIFSALTDVVRMPFNRDLICEQIESALGLEV